MDKKINVVQKDNMVFYGSLKKVNAHDIILSTMRLKDITIALDQISELYIDTQA